MLLCCTQVGLMMMTLMRSPSSPPPGGLHPLLLPAHDQGASSLQAQGLGWTAKWRGRRPGASGKLHGVVVLMV
jgi:hypothetical protein